MKSFLLTSRVRIALTPGLTALLLVPFAPRTIGAQGTSTSFSSGSTGADGAFAPTTSQSVQLPASGVFNFTSVTIPTNVTITFIRNAKNTPVTILATGDVNISGQINVSGTGGNGVFPGQGGPGGFDGGPAGSGFSGNLSGATGNGPGAGGGGGAGTSSTTAGIGGGAGHGQIGTTGTATLDGFAGTPYGTSALLPLIGGSGGGGGGAVPGTSGGGGGGGGGAILIAGSTNITFAGATIMANGANGDLGNAIQAGHGGGGSGGSIRIVANRISGSVQFQVNPGQIGNAFLGFGGPGTGGPGIVRVEAFDITGLSAFTGFNVPISTSLPDPATAPNGPQLVIASVGGVTAPASPLGTFSGTPDIILPAAQANPVTVVVQASGIPVGTPVTITVVPTNGLPSPTQALPLAGTTASSSTTASVALPPGVNVLTASASIDLTVARAGPPLIINGDRVDRIEIAASFGGSPQTTYVTHSGKRVTQ